MLGNFLIKLRQAIYTLENITISPAHLTYIYFQSTKKHAIILYMTQLLTHQLLCSFFIQSRKIRRERSLVEFMCVSVSEEGACNMRFSWETIKAVRRGEAPRNN